MEASASSRSLNNVVQGEINDGARVVYQTSDAVTLERGKRVNNVLHLIVSLFIGPWAVVWAIFTFTGGVRRERIAVDESGNVNRTALAGSGVPTWAKVVSAGLAVLWILLLAVLFGA